MTPPINPPDPTAPIPPNHVADSLAGGDWGQLNLADSGPLAPRSKATRGRSWVALVAILGAIGVGLGGYWIFKPGQPPAPPLTVELPATIDTQEGRTIDIQIGAQTVGIPLDRLTFRLVDPPAGASIAPRTGRLTWTPTEAQGPGTYPLVVEVATSGPVHATATARAVVTVREVVSPLKLAAIADQASNGADPVRLTAQARDDDLPSTDLVYALEPGAPAGARIDPTSGEFAWDPRGSESGTYPVSIRVTRATAPSSPARASFAIRVTVHLGPVERVVAALKTEGIAAERSGSGDAAPDEPAVLAVGPDRITIIQFAATTEIDAALARESSFTGGPIQTTPVAFYRDDNLFIRHDGSNSGIASVLGAVFGNPTLDRKVTPTDIAKLIDLARDKGRLFQVKEYRTLRKIFADRFAERYETELKRAFGADHAATMAWLQARPEIRDEFFTAIDPAFDDVVAALRLFKTLKDEFPAAMEPFSSLAIATAVCWDQERGGVYDYTGHQRRVRAIMPPGLLDAVGQFRNLIESRSALQGRIQFLPWEFLLHIVNHKTPVDERRWALGNYGLKQSMIGKCYGEVPYDGRMLATHGRETRLNGQLYTLANLKTFGGVCSMQADYAARIGKSNGVPAAEVVGPSAYDENHAWVMWVELKEVSATGISFSLESHGRYRGDKYYVGTLHDPQTGQEITDRQLELRLQTVGVRPLARRHAELIMGAYPLIRDQARLDVTDQIKFLFKVMELCPGDEAAWLELARLSRTGAITAQHRKLMSGALDQLFRTFEAFPDFTWTVFDDLITAQTTPAQQLTFYARLIEIYENAERPDLACKARLRQADLLMAANRAGDAVEAISTTILKFPDEGRFVPDLLDRLEEICRGQNVKAGTVVQFYTEFLPKIPQKRGDRPSAYCMKTYERAIGLFERNNQAVLARDLKVELAALRAAESK